MIPPNTLLDDLGVIIGYSATNRLVDWFGGSDLYVPHEPDEDHVITKVIGIPGMRRLCREFGRCTLKIPYDTQRDIARRNRMIGLMLLKGINVNEISRAALISVNGIAKVRASLEVDGLLPLILGSRTSL
jgi:hypothetical protein